MYYRLSGNRGEKPNFALSSANKASPLRVAIKMRTRTSTNSRANEDYSSAMLARDRRAIQSDLIEQPTRRVMYDMRTYDVVRACENLQRDIMCAYGFFSVSNYSVEFLT